MKSLVALNYDGYSFANPYRGKETGETALLRQLLDCFQQGDVFLADRCYCSYFMIALMQELVELDIRAIRSTLAMDVLCCKAPGIVRKQMWTSLPAC